MPPPARKVSGGRQATLSFNHRVTKPSATKQSAKEAALPTKTVEPEDKKAKAEEDKEKVKAEPEKAEKDDLMAEIQAEEEDEEAQAKEEAPKADEKPLLAASRSEDEIAADAVTDAQIRRYWRSVEVQSMARRVHQEGLDLGEKVLRYFDVSSHFGPCVGITRKKRWMRAQRLGLSPPIEVLAVLVHEEAKGERSLEALERSSFDEILNPSVAV